MKRPRRYLALVFGILPLLYVGSYVLVSWNGHYQPMAFGLIEGPDEQPILAPKASCGYMWMPFELFDDSGGLRFAAKGYLPLIWIDQKCWHTADKVEAGRYPVKDYFDRQTMTYRDIEPN